MMTTMLAAFTSTTQAGVTTVFPAVVRGVISSTLPRQSITFHSVMRSTNFQENGGRDEHITTDCKADPSHLLLVL